MSNLQYAVPSNRAITVHNSDVIYTDIILLTNSNYFNFSTWDNNIITSKLNTSSVTRHMWSKQYNSSSLDPRLKNRESPEALLSGNTISSSDDMSELNESWRSKSLRPFGVLPPSDPDTASDSLLLEDFASLFLLWLPPVIIESLSPLFELDISDSLFKLVSCVSRPLADCLPGLRWLLSTEGFGLSSVISKARTRFLMVSSIGLTECVPSTFPDRRLVLFCPRFAMFCNIKCVISKYNCFKTNDENLFVTESQWTRKLAVCDKSCCHNCYGIGVHFKWWEKN